MHSRQMPGGIEWCVVRPDMLMFCYIYIVNEQVRQVAIRYRISGILCDKVVMHTRI